MYNPNKPPLCSGGERTTDVSVLVFYLFLEKLHHTNLDKLLALVGYKQIKGGLSIKLKTGGTKCEDQTNSSGKYDAYLLICKNILDCKVLLT